MTLNLGKSAALRAALGVVCAVACSACDGGLISEPLDGFDFEEPDFTIDPSLLVSYPVDCVDPEAVLPGRSPMRRLTVPEYDNTVRDLLGITSEPAAAQVDRERGSVSADERAINTLLVEQYMATAEAVAETADLTRLPGCDTSSCQESFLEPFLERAFRHPVEAETLADYQALFTTAVDELGSEEASRMVIEAVLQSPRFLYRVEPAPADGLRPLDGYEVATRLSYFLWGTLPDDVLQTAAASGELDSVAGIETHARRLLNDPRAIGTFERFFGAYLELDHLDDLEKDPKLFPNFSETIRTELRGETEAFVREVMAEDGSWRTLMTAPWSVLTPELAAYYGHDPISETQRVELDGAHHSGFLTHGAFTASHARSYETSPVHRGMFVRSKLLCGVVPDVPEGLDITPPDPDPNLTTRERLAEHRANATCGSCHTQIDPLGFAFEHFDAGGRFRADENGLPVDASGVIVDTIDLDGEFSTLVEMVESIVASDQGATCFSSHWYEYAFGRAFDETDACALGTVTEAFQSSDLDVRELLVALVTTDAFRYRAAEPAPGELNNAQ